MIYDIDNAPRAINWEARGYERIVQNARNLLCLRLGEVALDRWRGIDGMLNDVAVEHAQAMARSEIARVLAWEPRARVVDCGVRIIQDDNRRTGAFLLWARIEIEEE